MSEYGWHSTKHNLYQSYQVLRALVHGRQSWAEARKQLHGLARDLWKDLPTSRFYRDTFKFCENIWCYREWLWHDRDWDWCFLIQGLQVKLHYMEGFYRDHGCFVGREKVAAEIKLCRLLCDRILGDYELPGPDRYEWNPERTPIGLPVVKFLRPKSYDDVQRQADIDELFRRMAKHLRSWWD